MLDNTPGMSWKRGQDWVPQSDGECHLELNTWIIDLYTLYKNIHGTI